MIKNGLEFKLVNLDFSYLTRSVKIQKLNEKMEGWRRDPGGGEEP